jgi:hypothetical protein
VDHDSAAPVATLEPVRPRVGAARLALPRT